MKSNNNEKVEGTSDESDINDSKSIEEETEIMLPLDEDNESNSSQDITSLKISDFMLDVFGENVCRYRTIGIYDWQEIIKMIGINNPSNFVNNNINERIKYLSIKDNILWFISRHIREEKNRRITNRISIKEAEILETIFNFSFLNDYKGQEKFIDSKIFSQIKKTSKGEATITVIRNTISELSTLVNANDAYTRYRRDGLYDKNFYKKISKRLNDLLKHTIGNLYKNTPEKWFSKDSSTALICRSKKVNKKKNNQETMELTQTIEPNQVIEAIQPLQVIELIQTIEPPLVIESIKCIPDEETTFSKVSEINIEDFMMKAFGAKVCEYRLLGFYDWSLIEKNINFEDIGLFIEKRLNKELIEEKSYFPIKFKIYSYLYDRLKNFNKNKTRKMTSISDIKLLENVFNFSFVNDYEEDKTFTTSKIFFKIKDGYECIATVTRLKAQLSKFPNLGNFDLDAQAYVKELLKYGKDEKTIDKVATRLNEILKILIKNLYKDVPNKWFGVKFTQKIIDELTMVEKPSSSSKNTFVKKRNPPASLENKVIKKIHSSTDDIDSNNQPLISQSKMNNDNSLDEPVTKLESNSVRPSKKRTFQQKKAYEFCRDFFIAFAFPKEAYDPIKKINWPFIKSYLENQDIGKFIEDKLNTIPHQFKLFLRKSQLINFIAYNVKKLNYKISNMISNESELSKLMNEIDPFSLENLFFPEAINTPEETIKNASDILDTKNSASHENSRSLINNAHFPPNHFLEGKASNDDLFLNFFDEGIAKNYNDDKSEPDPFWEKFILLNRSPSIKKLDSLKSFKGFDDQKSLSLDFNCFFDDDFLKAIGEESFQESMERLNNDTKKLPTSMMFFSPINSPDKKLIADEAVNQNNCSEAYDNQKNSTGAFAFDLDLDLNGLP